MYSLMFLLPISFLISLGMCLTPELSKYVTLSPFTYMTTQWSPTEFYLLRFITYFVYFAVLSTLGKLFHEKLYIKSGFILIISLCIKIG